MKFIVPLVVFFLSTYLHGGEKSSIEYSQLEKDVIVATTQPYSANSLFVRTEAGPIILIDTPMTPSDTVKILKWIKKKWGAFPSYAFNSHWHFDATGGNKILKDHGIQIFASRQTNALLRKNGLSSAKSFSKFLRKQGFHIADEISKITPYEADIAIDIKDEVTLTIGGDLVKLVYPGPSHSKDSIGIFFPKRRLLYGGCAVRSDKKLGNTSDANLSAWPRAMRVFQKLNPKTVIPGHGKRFDPNMLQETLVATQLPQ